MKKFLAILLLLCSLPVCAETLTGGIQYSVNDARAELRNNRPSYDVFLTQNDYIDKYHNENYSSLLKGITKLNDRTLAIFSDGSYGVIYNSNPRQVIYYDKSGELINTEEKTGLTFPYGAYKYTPDGELVNMSLRVSQEETFIFTPLGKLIGHWIGKNCYDENGIVIMTRKILK